MWLTLSCIRSDGFYRICGKTSSIERCLGNSLPLSATLSSIRRPRRRRVQPVDRAEATCSSSLNQCCIYAYRRTQLDRQMFDAALQWAMKADKTHFWRSYKKSTKLESPHDSVTTIKRTATMRNKTDEYVQLVLDNRHYSCLVQGRRPSN